MKTILKIDSPDCFKKTVKVTYDNGSVGIESVYKDSYNNCFLNTLMGKVYFTEFSNGNWLEKIFKGEKNEKCRN